MFIYKTVKINKYLIWDHWNKQKCCLEKLCFWRWPN